MIKICTYNLGSGMGDYFVLRRWLSEQIQSIVSPPPEFKSQSDERAFETGVYEKLEYSSGVFIAGCGFEVICLQEVGNVDRPFMLELKKAGYVFIYNLARHFPDTVVAFQQTKLTLMQNYSILYNGFDIAVALLLHRVSGKKIAIVSAHVPGFYFPDPIPDDVRLGNDYCEAILRHLNSIHADIQIIGIDMNTNQAALPPLGFQRFKMFNLNHFAIIRSFEATNVNIRDQIYPMREIDYILVRKKHKRFFGLTTGTASSHKLQKDLQAMRLFDFSDEHATSDHLPITTEISIDD